MSGICPCTVGNSVSKALFGLRDVKKLNCDAPEEAASAQVLSRRVQHCNTMYHESPWMYLVTIRTGDGRELELKATEALYSKLKEGIQGQLTWQEEKILDFTEQEEALS